jgi:hypothetical protein
MRTKIRFLCTQVFICGAVFLAEVQSRRGNAPPDTLQSDAVAEFDDGGETLRF